MKKLFYSLGLAVFAVFVVAGIVQAASTIGTAITTGGTLSVTGASTLTGATTVTGALFGNGGLDRSTAAALAIGATNATSVTITPATTITGAATLSSTLGVTSDATFDTNTLKVDATNNFVGVGTTTPKSNLSISTSAGTAPTVRLLEVASTTGASLFKVLASGNTSVAGTFTATGAATLSSTLGLTSNLTVDTNTLIVDATNNFVGVGTTTPKSNLSISTSAGTAPTVRLFEVASTTGTSLFKVLASGNTSVAGTMAITGATTLTGAATLAAGLTVDTNTLKVDATNNFVGVGTTTPQSNFSVSTSAGTAPTVRLLEVASTTGASLFKVLASGNTSVAGTMAITGATTLTGAATLAAGLTVDTNTLKVDATNNFVGVGTTTPQSNLSVSTSAGTSPTTRLFAIASTTGATLLQFQANGNMTVDTNTFIVDAVNNFVGVGTTTPKTAFAISTSAQTTPATRLLEVASTTGATLFKVLASGAATHTGTLAVTATSTLSSGLIVDTNTFVVHPANNFVGVGTTTPKSNLSISTSAGTSPTTRLFAIASTTGTALFTVLASGNTTVAGTLAATGATTLTGAATLAAGLTVDTNTFKVDATNNFVGVGTTTPQSNLSISTSGQTTPATRLLEVASTTGATLFKVLASGAATHTGTLAVTATSTLSSGLIVDTDTLYVNPSTNRVGIASSTPKALFSVGGNSATSTIDISRICIQTNSKNGTRYRMFVTDAGVWKVEAGSCL